MTRYRLLAVGIVLAVATCFSCSGDTDNGAEGPRADDQARLTLLVFGEEEELRAYRSLAAAFGRETDGEVVVDLEEVPDRQALLTRLTTSIAAKDPPDLFLINYRFFGQFAASGALEPLEGRLDDSTLLDRSAFYELPMEAFSYRGGGLMCLPQNVSSLVVYFNQAIFQDAGVPEPAAGWTWDGMVAAASALSGGGRHGIGIEPSIIRLAPFVWSNGAELVDDAQHPTRMTLDTPEAIEALDRFLDLRRSGVTPSAEEAASEDVESRFSNGRLAMLLQSRRVTPQFRQISAFEWDVAPLPVLDQPAGVLHSDAYCMTKDSSEHDAAWRFLEFALGEEGATLVAQTGRTVPSLRSVAESDAFLDPDVAPAHSGVFLDTIPAVRQLPTISTWPEVEEVADEILAAAWEDSTPASEVARRLDVATRPIFARGS